MWETKLHFYASLIQTELLRLTFINEPLMLFLAGPPEGHDYVSNTCDTAHLLVLWSDFRIS